MGLTLASGALGGLHAPAWAWVAAAILAGLCFLRAAQLHFGVDRKSEAPVFVAVESEIALAREEALEMAKLLRVEWPYISVDGALVETALPDWRAKTTDFIGTVLGAAQRAAFKASETGSDVLERLESEGRFLESLSTGLSADSIRTDDAGFLAARRKRRDHDAARFLTYNHYRAPGAPPPADLASQLDGLMQEGMQLLAELSAPVEPEAVGGGMRISFGGPPAEWQEKAGAFIEGIRELLTERHPALLTVFRDAFNGHLAQDQETRETAKANAGRDTRSTPQKVRDLATFGQSGPAREVEAALEGLAAVRHRLDDVNLSS